LPSVHTSVLGAVGVQEYSQPLPRLLSILTQPAAHAPMPHVLETHVSVATFGKSQGLLQPPQWSTLVVVFTHAPLHNVGVAPEQVDTQEPLLQAVFTPQTAPAPAGGAQPPQFAGSLFVSTQTLPHLVRPGVVHWQVPLTQLWPAPHFVPQAPQLLLSVWRLTQVSTVLTLQTLRPGPHSQTLLLQTCP
jgi:hypothetical protein